MNWPQTCYLIITILFKTGLLDSYTTQSYPNLHLQHVKLLIRANISGHTQLFIINTVEDLNTFKQAIKLLPESMELQLITTKNEKLIFNIRRNMALIGPKLMRKHFTNSGKPIVQTFKDVQLSSCYFIEKDNSTVVSVNVCKGIEGVLEISFKTYLIKPMISGDLVQHKLEEPTQKDYFFKCPVGNTDTSMKEKRVSRDIGLPAGHNLSTRYIELYVVADNSLYRRTGGLDATVQRVVDIVNYASALCTSLNIYIALVGIEIWSDKDKILYPPPTITNNHTEYNSDIILNSFSIYRLFHILSHTPNDNSQLLSARDFDGKVIGKAPKGYMCSQRYSIGIVYDVDHSSYIWAANTLVHELGHSLGLPHSDVDSTRNCGCHNERFSFDWCIMSSSSHKSYLPTKWSHCSKELLFQNYDEKLLCLRNKPDALEQTFTESVCGNYFVEEGEQCDCGPVGQCASKCCNAATCQLHSNASCATGSCCDIQTCSMKIKSTLCRPIQDRECDLEEFCNGRSEWCPSDKYKQDGTPCYNRGNAFCYEGKCNSHNSQCFYAWGVNNAEKSEDRCYERFNSRGNILGNCGWTRQGSVIRFHRCLSDDDRLCGLLHCKMDSVDNSLQPNIEVRYFYAMGTGAEMCSVISFVVGTSEHDPGQVPNGAKCGENKMCIDSKCYYINGSGTSSTDAVSQHPPATVVSPTSWHCNGHGFRSRSGVCHCDDGWAPPFCRLKIGGSTTSTTYSLEASGRSKTIKSIVILAACGLVPTVVIVAVIVIYQRGRQQSINVM